MLRNQKTVILLLFMQFVLLCRPFTAQAAEPDPAAMDVVIVIDTSGSMNYTDPDHMAAEAALLFLNMLEERGSRAAVISFSDEVQILRPLKELRMDQEGDELRSLLEDLKREGDTDLGAAAQQAVDLLNTEAPSGKNTSSNRAILFFTDGCIDLPEETLEERSHEQFAQAVDQAAAADCRIYSIGLDSAEKDSRYHLDETILKEAAGKSNGNYRYVQEASQLPEVFHLVFSDFIESRSRKIGDLAGSEQQPESTMQITIPDNSVLEADIILIPTDYFGTSYDLAPDKITLSDPSGKREDLPDPETMRMISTKAYTLIKLISPGHGNWKLSVTDDREYHVHVNLLLQYQIEFVCEMEETLDGTEDGPLPEAVRIRAFFERNGSKVEDPMLYEQFACSAQILRENSPLAWGYPEEEKITMEFSKDSACWEETLPVYPGSAVSVLVHTEGETLSRDSEMLHFTSSGSDAIIVHRLPESIYLAGLFPEDTALEPDLGSCFEAWDGSACMITASGERTDIFEADLLPEAGRFSLSGKHSGSGMLNLEIKDKYGNQTQVSIPVTVRIQWERVRIIVFTCCGVLLSGFLIGLFLFVRKRYRRSSDHISVRKLVFCLDRFSSEEGTYVCCFKNRTRTEQLDRLWMQGMAANEAEAERYEKIGRIAGPSMAEIRISRRLFHHSSKGLIISSKCRNSILVNCYGNHCRRMYLEDQDAFEIHLLPASDLSSKDENIILYGEFEG